MIRALSFLQKNTIKKEGIAASLVASIAHTDL